MTKRLLFFLIVLLGLFLLATPLLLADKMQDNQASAETETFDESDFAEEDLEFAETKQLLSWKGEFFSLKINGDIKTLSYNNWQNEESKLNPENILDNENSGNLTELTLKLDITAGELSRFYMLRRIGRHFKNKVESETETEDSVEQAYISMEMGQASSDFVSIGKQRVKWGTGAYWNPVDTINTQTSLDEKEKDTEGKVSYRMDLTYSDYSLMLLHVPNQDSTELSSENFEANDGHALGAAKLYAFLWDTDFSIYWSKKEKEAARNGFSFATVFSEVQFFGESSWWWGESEKFYVKRTRERQSGNFSGQDYTIPAVYDYFQKDGFFSKSLVGFQYTHNGDLTIVFELYHDSGGYDSDEMKSYIEYLDYLRKDYQSDLDSLAAVNAISPGLLNTNYPSRYELLLLGDSIYDFAKLRKNYLHLSLTKIYAWNRFDLFLDLIVNLDDYNDLKSGNAFVRPRISYKAITDWLFTLYSQHFMGDQDSEFGMLYNTQSIFAEIKYFF